MHNTTLKDVAQEAGLAVSTVSRALADHPAIPEKTKQRVRKAAQKLNYRPNAQARALRNAKTNTIGVVIPHLTNPYFAELAAAVQDAALEAGLYTLLGNSNDDPQQLIQAVEIMQSQRVDGLIVVPHVGTEAALSEIIANNTPLVLVDRELNSVNATSVSTDPSAGLDAAITLLATRGHQRIGYLAGPLDTSTGMDRLNAFKESCARQGLEHSVHLGGYQEQQGYVGTQNILSDVSAIIAGDSMMTIGALRACHDLNLRPGIDIELIGFDDFPVFQLQSPPLTIIDQDVSAMGRRAFSELQERIGGTSSVKKVKLPTSLILRGATPEGGV